MKWVRHISLLLVFVLMFTSSAFAIGTQKKQNTQYDGETLYRGIVFGQGPVAQLLPEYFNKQALEQASSEDAKKTVDFIIQKMKSMNPDYFDEFSKAVYSGNRLAIDRQLAVGGEM
ncbi:hypothetical protein [Paenibacillus elgii]|uniref:hypothetical protein n=1 Tax=Paenibacillus elgii TaxID=189691 RepID=UPI000248C51E|nr:hypothetical protein [Paenibacillus elgii]